MHGRRRLTADSERTRSRPPRQILAHIPADGLGDGIFGDIVLDAKRRQRKTEDKNRRLHQRTISTTPGSTGR